MEGEEREIASRATGRPWVGIRYSEIEVEAGTRVVPGI